MQARWIASIRLLGRQAGYRFTVAARCITGLVVLALLVVSPVAQARASRISLQPN
jgi:hypothetical protein